jgi:DNA-cytosine methyltransferase
MSKALVETLQARIDKQDVEIAELRAIVTKLNNILFPPCLATPATNTLVYNNQNAISLFSGAGGDTLGLERAGYKVIAFNEFKEPAIKTHRAVFPESVMLVNPETGKTDIKKVPDQVFQEYKGKVRLIFAGFPCFVAGTRVLTDKGYMPIESVTLENTLLTHTGKFQPIVNLQKKIYDQTLYDIRIKYHPEIITATDEHPFYIRTQVRTWDNTNRKYTYTFEEPQWKNAKTLTMNDYFGMVINSKSIVPEFTLNKQVNGSRIDKLIYVLNDPDQWFMMGYFIGDGWIEETIKMNGNNAHKIRFAINNADKETVLPRLQKILPLTDKQCSTGAADKYGCADFAWYTILKQFGKYANGKLIPEWVQDAPANLIQEFINGYHAADGCFHDREVRFTTVSYNLALGLQRLYLKLGHIVSVQKTIRPKTYVIQGRTVNQRDTYVVNGIMDLQRNVSSFIDGQYVWMKPSSIHVRPTTPVPVYNFEVDTDNSYIVDNTIVHNCQGFSHAGTKRVDDKRNELVYEFARAARIAEPEWIIGENVKGLLARKGKDPAQPADAPLRPVIDIIKDLFERTGYKITYKVIDVTEIGVPQHRKRLIIVGHKGTQYPHMPWDDLTPASTPPQTAIRSFLEPHLKDAMELPALYRPAEQGTHYWIPTTETAATGTPHPNLALLVSGTRNPSGKEKKANPKLTGKIVEPAGLISFGVRKGGYHGMVVNPDVACNTIISTYNLCPRLFVGLHNAATGKYWIRCMTPRELGQIQGFPADYAWQGTEKEQIIQIGNAVPPPLGERIVKSLERVVFKAEPQVADDAVEDDESEEEAE